MKKTDANITAIISKKNLKLIKKIAKRNHQSISGFIRVVIDNYLEKNNEN